MTDTVVTPQASFPPVADTEAATAAAAPMPNDQKTTWQKTKAFAKEIWHTHDFWPRFIVFKTAAAALAAVSVVGISFLVTAPLALVVGAVAGVMFCGALVFYTGITAWDRLRGAYSNVSTAADNKPRQTIAQRAAESPLVKKLTNGPAIQKLLKSDQWKKAQSIAKRQEGFFLSYLAGGSSIVVGIISFMTLITQIVALPVIALGGLLALPVLLPALGVISALSGVYVGVRHFAHTLTERRKAKAKKAAETAASVAAPAVETAPVPAETPLTPAFDKAGAPAETKKTEEKAETSPKPATPPPATP